MLLILFNFKNLGFKLQDTDKVFFLICKQQGARRHTPYIQPGLSTKLKALAKLLGCTLHQCASPSIAFFPFFSFLFFCRSATSRQSKSEPIEADAISVRDELADKESQIKM